MILCRQGISAEHHRTRLLGYRLPRTGQRQKWIQCCTLSILTRVRMDPVWKTENELNLQIFEIDPFFTVILANGNRENLRAGSQSRPRFP